MNKFKKFISIIHREGWKFSAISLFVSLILLVIWPLLSFISFLITFFILWFFRDPERNTPIAEGKIISPADGKVCLIDLSVPPEELQYVFSRTPRYFMVQSKFSCVHTF